MKKKILVVDDDSTQNSLYVEVFTAKGYETFSAIDGLDGLEIAKREKPDLVFTGIQMPRMDGFELIRNLRDNQDTAKIPIIMFSHLGKEEDRHRAGKFGQVEFMVKGIDGPKNILQKVEELINAKDKQPI